MNHFKVCNILEQKITVHFVFNFEKTETDLIVVNLPLSFAAEKASLLSN
jgi:hypothetical protein